MFTRVPVKQRKTIGKMSRNVIYVSCIQSRNVQSPHRSAQVGCLRLHNFQSLHRSRRFSDHHDLFPNSVSVALLSIHQLFYFIQVEKQGMHDNICTPSVSADRGFRTELSMNISADMTIKQDDALIVRTWHKRLNCFLILPIECAHLKKNNIAWHCTIGNAYTV